MEKPFPAATNKQIAEAALAGYRVEREPDNRWPWVSYKPGGVAVNRHLSEREAWACCWYVLQLWLETTGETC